MSDLATNDDHGGVTDDDLEKWLADHPVTGPFASDPHPPLDDPAPAEPVPAQVEPSPVSDPVADPEPGTDPAPSAEPVPDEGESGGEGDGEPTTTPVTDDPQAPPLTPDELAQLQSIRDAIQSDPALRDRIVEYYNGGGGAVPIAQPTTPPPVPAFDPSTLDLTDPSVAALYSYLTEQQATIEQLRASQTQIANQSYEAMRVQTDALYKRAADSFRASRSLDDTEMDRVAGVAARLNVLPALMSGVDPLTGLPSRPDPITAMTRALDIAYNSLPEYAAKVKAAAEQTQRRHNSRKQKLAAVQGSSGSVPRTPAPPADPKQAMIQEVAAMMSGDWSEN